MASVVRRCSAPSFQAPARCLKARPQTRIVLTTPRAATAALPVSISNDSYQLLRRLSDYAASHAATAAVPPAISPQGVEQIMDSIYDDLDTIFFSKGGYVVPLRERSLIDATGGSAAYGEILPAGVQQMLDILRMDSSSVFCDLGCGRGRAVLQVAMASRAARVIGLELSDSRLEQAEMALDALRSRGHQLQPTEFKSANLADCSLEDGTHFYLCSTAFGSGLCRSLAQRLAASPNFQVLVTSRQLPMQPYLYLLGEAPCEYTFNAAGKFYVYVKSLYEAPVPVAAQFLCSSGVCWLPSDTPHSYHLSVAVEEELAAAPSCRFVTLPQGN